MDENTIKTFEDVTTVSALDDNHKKPTWLRRVAKGFIWDDISKTVDRAMRTGFEAVKAVWASEDIFFGDRENQDYVEGDFAEIQKRAIERNNIIEIAEDKDYESLVLRFREMVALERIAHNLLFARWHKPDKTEGKTAKEALKNIEQQEWQNLLSYKKFFTIKALLCLTKSPEGYVFNKESFHEVRLNEVELRREYLRQQVKLLFSEAAETVCDGPEEFAAFVDSTIEGLIEDEPTPPDLPTKAPKLYKDRAERSQKPVDFVKTHYKAWLGKGLLRPHIKALDEPLYRALYKHGIPKEFDTLLPKAAGKSVRTKNLSEAEAIERTRAQARERNRRMYHRRQQNA